MAARERLRDERLPRATRSAQQEHLHGLRAPWCLLARAVFMPFAIPSPSSEKSDDDAEDGDGEKWRPREKLGLH
jgi:hypothetical protein